MMRVDLAGDAMYVISLWGVVADVQWPKERGTGKSNDGKKINEKILHQKEKSTLT